MIVVFYFGNPQSSKLVGLMNLVKRFVVEIMIIQKCSFIVRPEA